MHQDKKQITQLIVLGVLVLLCVGYVSFKVLSPKSAPPAPINQAVKQGSEPDEAAKDVSSALTAVNIASTKVFPDITSVPSRRDPFTPQALPMPEGTVKQLKPAVRVSEARPLQKSGFKNNNPWAKIEPVRPIPNFSQGDAPMMIAQSLPQHEPDPKFTLTGVIRGDENVAIIRVGDSGRYIVKQGQLIEGRYKVLSVSSDGAVLAHKNRRISVKLGGVN